MNERHWGVKARQDGLPRSACPYTGVLPGLHWREGWDMEDQRLQLAANRERRGLPPKPEHDQRGWQPK